MNLESRLLLGFFVSGAFLSSSPLQQKMLPSIPIRNCYHPRQMQSDDYLDLQRNLMQDYGE